MYKNNSGIKAKSKINFINQTTVINKGIVGVKNPLLFLYEAVVCKLQKMKPIIKILTFILLFGLNSCEFNNEQQEYAEMLIEKIEIFKQVNNRLPKDVSELGLTEKMDSPAFYQIQTDSTYMVWYGLSVGESKVYRSSTKKWTEEG